MIFEDLKAIIKEGLKKAIQKEHLNIDPDFPIELERPKEKIHGDWATNIALATAKKAKKNPKDLARYIVDNLPKNPFISKIEIAGPGFINFFLTNEWFHQVLKKVELADHKYGQIELGKEKKVNIEFVSANPVGPLHIGHGRWAAVGDSLANLLETSGYKVTREFYINDYGHQVNLFTDSVMAAYDQLYGRQTAYPEEGYKGSYINEIAQKIKGKHSNKLLDNPKKDLEVEKEALKLMLDSIKKTLEDFGVKFDIWSSEKALYQTKKVGNVIKELQKKGLTYEKEGAIWLKTSQFGDEKDRVLLRSNGEPTYFASDIAYHKDKLKRKFDKLINIWGADHHGYVARVKAAIQTLGYPSDKLQIVLGQLVSLYRGKEVVKMSKRTGELITFDELLEEVGKDAVRYIFLTKSTDTPLDFDIELAKEQSEKNPVYYVQYAHARICSILKYAAEKKVSYQGVGKVDLSHLKEESEIDLIRQIEQFEEVIEKGARSLAPHILTAYASDLATSFHYFYTKCRVITDDTALTQARLALLNCTHITLRNVLKLLGVSAPERM